MHALLRSLWDEPRPVGAPARLWRDWVLVGAVVATAVLEAALRTDLPGRFGWAALTVAVAPALLWRRTRPLLVVAIAFAAGWLGPPLFGTASQLGAMAFMLVLPYALFRWGSGREVVAGTAIILASASATLVTGPTRPGDVVGGFAVLFATMALGAAIRFGANARLRDLDQVKLLERERLARDLHDTVAHHVSAIAIRAQAGLATAGSEPEAATDALRLIEGEASRTLAEMRTMVRALRQDQAADLEPSPRVRDLERLRASPRGAPVVDVQLAGDLDDLPQPVGAAIYRLAQESVTNARRHARHATRIEVRVAADATSVRLRVSDDGDINLLRPAPGYGLLGMVERAALLGGACEAGPDPDRGWTVTAVLPRTGWAT